MLEAAFTWLILGAFIVIALAVGYLGLILALAVLQLLVSILN